MILDHLFQLQTHDPHKFLGLDASQKRIRVWRPGASEVYVEVKNATHAMEKMHDLGLFQIELEEPVDQWNYQIWHQDGTKGHDPYSFAPSFGEMDQYLLAHGTHYQLYEVMGGRLIEHEGVMGARFTLWAPNAIAVSVVGDFNHWNGLTNPMRSLGYSGVWEIFIPGLEEGMRYKFEIRTRQGETLIKSDPYGLHTEVRPKTASILLPLRKFEWSDDAWVANKEGPMNIYEVHLGSWKKGGKEFLNYREIAHLLADYCLEMGYTHIELMPVSEHPLDESWGYQITGYYAVTSRYGTLQDFQYFVNHLHAKGIHVFLDWVPGHFPNDQHGLLKFDGTALYEHEDPRKGFHPHWSTHIFNYGRKEVSNFLIANALFWLKECHIDGLRVDAVASMLYLDYGREYGQWIPNQYGGKENIEAMEFLRHLNSIVKIMCPNACMIAEESTSFSGVTRAVEKHGLGFDYKWNMGWMNDTLRYISKDPIYRKFHQNDLTFSLIYAFSEWFVLVLSHDEVVHGKNSLMGKMAGDQWQQFANMRLLVTYMMCHPGKKLLFMGGEIGQWNEWHCKKEIEWFLLEYPIHHGLQRLVKEINHFYLQHEALWHDDYSYQGFEWISFSDHDNCVICYLRKGAHETLLCVHNFTPNFVEKYSIPFSGYNKIEQIFNSDETKYGGSGSIAPNVVVQREKNTLEFTLLPLATQIFKVEE